MWNDANFKQIYTLKHFIAFKMAYYLMLFHLRGNLDFPEFLQKSFITSATGDLIAAADSAQSHLFTFGAEPYNTTT